jgi:S-adenosylmethionine synthetase
VTDKIIAVLSALATCDAVSDAVLLQVRLTREHNEQSAAIEMMTKQHTILIQKKLRVEAEITAQRTDTVGIEKEIHHLQVDLSKLDSLLYRERGSENFLQQENQLLETQFMAALKVNFMMYCLL